ncbi:uncharacterized protein LOC114242580 [Bombyx mandarina]|uniref:Uncharacterized protein LOC114242580 n=1 Tax=Bombyx mandarina TaxID=7092 RepID=A0A6J2JJZ9_BOMMA|nr:uncharacterized protein LOC114242580 [Bombyx mandarina]
MVLNAAVQMLREADELKQNILNFKSGTSMLQDQNIWTTQQQLQKIYQKVLVLDLDYALEKKVEQDLWNVGFKQQIEALQAISKDRKNPQRSEGQAMLSLVLQAAAGFYLCLLHQICTTFKLDLPFRRRTSLVGWVEGWGAGAGAGELTAGGRLPAAPAARYICQHCLVHLGDLARYRQQLRVAHTFYRQAVCVWAHSGQPYNQLALVASRGGRRLAALYWQVRALLVRAPFPPAPANLARTLRAAASACNTEVPVLPGVTQTTESTVTPTTKRLDSHSYITELMKALHLIHSVEDLKTASSMVSNLNSSLTALVATDSFESMTLVKMTCVLIWLVHSSTEDLTLDSSTLTDDEALAAELSRSLAAGAVLALLLPAYTSDRPPEKALPALRVWVQWAVGRGAGRGAGWGARAALWPALAHTLNALPQHAHQHSDAYLRVPLPEDEELYGFVPLEGAFDKLRFNSHASWDTYGGRLPDLLGDDDMQSPADAAVTLSGDSELERKIRAHRLIELGKRLAEKCPQHFSYTEEDGKVTFTGANAGGEQLSRALAELSLVQGDEVLEGEGGGGADPHEDDSEDEPTPPPPPVIISEADFREKVREKRVGILKPQGSLERAREERALACTQEDQPEIEVEESKSEDRREGRKPRVNIAMAAIMRKQEETNKQVKFVTPPPTPDSTADSTDSKEQDKPKIIQPKVMKSLANLPIGRKTGGILSLKDKSAGYPHLVNVEPEIVKKPESDEKKDVKFSQNTNQSSQNYTARQETPSSPNWGGAGQQGYDAPRAAFQKNYGIPKAGISYNAGHQSNQGIRLPVVNPREIDVTTAAIQKQSSRQDLFQDTHKFGHNYQVSGDKKNFLNDLPPRFANQYRYWQAAQESQFNENKFRDDNFTPSNAALQPFNQQRNNWLPDNYQQVMSGWKPENQTGYNSTYSMQPNMQAHYYAPVNPNIPSYTNIPTYNQMPNSMGQQKQENMMNPSSYLQSAIGQPQLQTLQNIVTSPNFSAQINNFGAYVPNPSYDSTMYPQFTSKLGYQPLHMKMMDKQPGYPGKESADMGLGFGPGVPDMSQRNLSMNYKEPLGVMGPAQNVEKVNESTVGAASGNTYSLFSGAPDALSWGQSRQPQQSLWTGPISSPLERLLEQQKQMKPPTTQ